MPIGVSGFAIAAAVAAAAVSAYGAVKSGEAQAASAKYNAQVAENNALIEQQNARWEAQKGEVNAAAAEQKTRSTVGAIKAAQAANGVDVNSGSSLDVRSSASELGELDAINIRSNAARTAYGYDTKAQSDLDQSQLDKFEASNDESAGQIKATSTLLSSAGSAFGNYKTSGSL